MAIEKYFEAWEDFCRLNDLRPNNPGFVFKRGQANFYLKKYPEALEDFAKASAMNPNVDEYHYYMGRTYGELSRHEEAVHEFTRAIQFNFQSADYYYHRGISCTLIEKVEEAYEDFSKSIKIDSKFAGAYFQRALASFKLKKMNQFFIDFNTAISLDPSNPSFSKALIGIFEKVHMDLVAAQAQADRLGRILPMISAEQAATALYAAKVDDLFFALDYYLSNGSAPGTMPEISKLCSLILASVASEKGRGDEKACEMLGRIDINKLKENDAGLHVITKYGSSSNLYHLFENSSQLLPSL